MCAAASRIADQLGLEHALVQAPMAGSTTPALVAAVSEAGALGSYGAAQLGPDELRAVIAEIRSLTAKPFAINLFAWRDPDPAGADAVAAVDAVLAAHRERLGLGEADAPGAPRSLEALLAAQLEVVAAERVPVFSFTFGIPPLDAVRDAGAYVIGTATTTAEAAELERAGVDAIVAQGSEAGGHRGTFAGPMEDALVGTLALVPQVVDAVSVPVLAAGAIMDGRGIAAARALGADAVQLGTAFLACPECGAPEAHKQLLPRLADSSTRITRGYSGRECRVVATGMLRALEAAGPLPFPLQSERTRPVARAAAEQGDTERALFLAGQAAGMARALPAGELVRTLMAESAAVIDRLR